MPDLIDQLRQAPQSFNLFQALSILERSEPARAALGTSVGLDESVRLVAQIGMGFAPSDLASLADSGAARPAADIGLDGAVAGRRARSAADAVHRNAARTAPPA